MGKIVIVDDELHCTDILYSLISNKFKEHEIIAVFNNPKEALNFIQNNTFDLLFLDIQMPELTGFKLLDKLDSINFDVVFTTAYDQYAIKAFNYSAFNYLLKPITIKALTDVLKSWSNRKAKIKEEQWQILREYASKPEKQAYKIALPSNFGYEIIEVDDVIRCRSENTYSIIYIKSGEQLTISKTLKEVEDILPSNLFIRVHQSHIINSKCIKTISRKDGGSVMLNDGSEVPVSRQKKDLLDKLIESMIYFK